MVPTRNRQPFVGELITTILQGTETPGEIIVIDQSDARDEQLDAIAAEHKRVVVHRLSPSRGVSAARNEGIRTARYDVIAFMDDDVLPTTTWLATLVSTLVEAGGRTLVTGQVRSGKPEARGGFAPSLNPEAQPAVYEGRSAANILWTNNMAMFRSVVDEIGFFDERLGPGRKRFPAGEDNEFCFRALEAGYRIVYQPEAIVYHRAWRPDADYLGVRWDYGRGQGGFYAKHLRVRDPYILRQMARHVVSCGVDVVRQSRKSPRVAVGSAAYGAGIVSAAVEWMLTQRLLGKRRRGAD